MPKTDIDYGNTIIYKIYCKDTNIKDLYVGHTTNFVQRKYAHKMCVISNYENSKLYKIIRENGGWDNWTMEIVDFFNCNNQYEARIKEQQYFISLNANLNSVEPVPREKINEIEKKIIPVGKVGDIFYCKYCDYTCKRKDNFDKHLVTPKHNNSIFVNQKVGKVGKVGKTRKSVTHMIDTSYACDKCSEKYISRSGLWRHKQKCKTINIQSSNDVGVESIENTIEPIFYNGKDISNLKPEECSLDIIMHLVKQNEEFQKIMMDQNHKFLEIQEQMINFSGSTTNINSHNKTMNNQFNLNLFLNETCKDAMNINDFIDYVTVNLDDFENFGKVGYPKALGEIIVRNLNELDIKIRPIHCSDLKREVLHVKHDGVWHSDDSQKFIKKSITYVANKNIRQRPLWQDENPESKNCLTSTYERFNNICLASLGPATDEQEADFLKKITTTIAKQVVIDKKKKY